jgi:hypothetical protein
LGDIEKAKQFLEKIWKSNVQADKILGLIYFDQKDYQNAKKYFYYYLQKNKED